MKDNVARRPTALRIEIPQHTRPHWQAAVTAEHDLQCDLEGAAGIDREIIEKDLAAATAHREWMMIDVMTFGGWLHDEPKRSSRRGRPIDPELMFRDKQIAAHSLLLELTGWLTKAAVAHVMQRYQVGRTIAFTARNRWIPLLQKINYDRAPLQQQQQRIKAFEATCQSR